MTSPILSVGNVIIRWRLKSDWIQTTLLIRLIIFFFLSSPRSRGKEKIFYCYACVCQGSTDLIPGKFYASCIVFVCVFFSFHSSPSFDRLFSSHTSHLWNRSLVIRRSQCLRLLRRLLLCRRHKNDRPSIEIELGDLQSVISTHIPMVTLPPTLLAKTMRTQLLQ